MNTDDDIDAIDIEEEENYFVSLTDLMTGVVFIFVLLLVTYAATFHTAQQQLETERQRAAISSREATQAEAQAKEFKEEAEKSKLLAETTKINLDRELTENRLKAEKIDLLAKALKQREEQRRKILTDVVSRLEKRGVKVTLDAQNGIIHLPEELLFDSGQAELRPESARALTILADELEKVLQQWCSPDQDFRLEAMFIEGHTDSNPIKTAKFADNWELSTARAVNISRALSDAQPQILQLKNPNAMPVLGVSGYGANRPVSDNVSDEGRRKNRRIDLRFVLAYPTDDQVTKATKGLGVP